MEKKSLPLGLYEDILEEAKNLDIKATPKSLKIKRKNSKSPSKSPKIEEKNIKSPTKLLSDYFLHEGCNNIYKHLSEIELLSSSGVSDSIIISAILNYNEIVNQNVILKISYIAKSNVLNNSLIVEEEIYRNIMSNLLNNNHTPHVIKYITSILHCNLDFNKFPQKAFKYKKTFPSILTKLSQLSDYDTTNATITILSKSTGQTLHPVFESLNNNEQLIVIFQLLYTILCFNNITLRHNDLHFRNIFVENEDKKNFTYKIFNEFITIPTNLNCKIYDFDRAAIYHPAVSRNYYIDIDYCEDFNQCSGINNIIDLQSIIAQLIILYKDSLGPDVKTWINQITSEHFRTSVKKRKYYHILYDRDITKSDDLLPLKTCIKSLIHFIKKNDLAFDEKSSLIYEPPLEYKIKEWHPLSNNTYVFTKIEDIKDNFDEKEIDSIDINATSLLLLYRTEFLLLKYNILKTGKELFIKFNKLKNIKDKDNAFKYIQHCILLSIPFWYKIDNQKIKEQLSEKLGIKYKKEIEANIYNLFNNLLPINMPLI